VIAQGYILIKELNTEILGIAMGKFWEAERISEKLKIPFSILLDEEGEISSA